MWTALMLPSCSCFCSTALYSDAISLIIRELLWGETQETMPRFAVRISLRTSFLTSRCSLSEDPERKFDSGLRAGNGWASPELFSSKGPWQWLWPHHKLPSNWVVKSDRSSVEQIFFFANLSLALKNLETTWEFFFFLIQKLPSTTFTEEKGF